jgi:tol-pal system protein YbgF
MKHQTLPIFLAVLLVSACSLSMRGSQQAAGNGVEEMKSRILELQKKAAVTDVELERLRRELARLEALVRQQKSGGAESASGARSATTGSLRPAAPVEESDLELERVSAAPIERGAAPSGGSAPEEGTVGYRPVQPAAQALYDRGYTEFHQGRYLDAEATFQRFLQAHRDTELADNAQYWIGESRFARGDLQGALAAFRETAQRYPEGNKVPDALLKEGACLEGLGDVEGARLRYSEVLRRFPGSAAAAMAEERRASLG